MQTSCTWNFRFPTVKWLLRSLQWGCACVNTAHGTALQDGGGGPCAAAAQGAWIQSIASHTATLIPRELRPLPADTVKQSCAPPVGRACAVERRAGLLYLLSKNEAFLYF